MASPVYHTKELTFVPEGRLGLVGNVDDTPRFMRSVDAILLPSPKEGGPIVLLEAWAAGVPFFMFSTGLAVQYPDCVHVLPWKATPEQAAVVIESTMADARLVETKRQCESKGWDDMMKGAVATREVAAACLQPPQPDSFPL